MALTRLGLNQAINLSTNTTGTLGVANGGTGLASGTSGQFLKFTGSTTLASAADNGKTLQVVSATAQNSSNTTSNSFVDTVTTLDITQSATSSKILVTYDSGVCYENNNYSNFYCYATIDRGGTNLSGSGSSFSGIYAYNLDQVNDYGFNFSMNYLDSPSTTSATTYKIQWRVNNAGAHIYYNLEGKSTITLTEIGA